MSTAPATGSASTRSKRIPLWDNARFACITLVVMGHGIQRLVGDSDAALTVYLVIYSFHMPAFAFISGYFSKSGAPSIRQMQRVITDIVLPYVFMESIWTAVKFFAEGDETLNPTKPSWTLWFLLALAIFRLVLPYLALVRWPLLWAVVLSVGVGYLDNVDSTFSLARLFGILPFFVLGWRVKKWDLFARLRLNEHIPWWVRTAALAIFAMWAACVWVFVDLWRDVGLRHWFFYDQSYDGLGQDAWWAGAVRLAVLLLNTVLIAAFIVLIPRHRNVFSGFGQATMYVYLLHSFALYPLRESGLLKHEALADYLLPVMLGVSFLLAVALSTWPVRRFFRPLIEPKPHWIFTRDDRLPAGPSRTDPTGSRRPRTESVPTVAPHSGEEDAGSSERPS
ncbi:acyltransferase family protein [Paramicrobacterium chengjingii]|uniref:Acyltransferase family protein n=1 Tax=Paramicrobacterium chengjingii TaxID=2769067 RepID=A0ABX6YEQ9_9MICO|nr:acyltransferase family protein [Microbacterium chengjingii]QPZ37160.1 acyltransferase family protein [Microbacterium chengjingii]